MIRNIKFKDETGLDFEPENLNIFVGPNNSGKSMTLREIYYDLTLEVEQRNTNILQEIDQDTILSEEQIKTFIEKYSVKDLNDRGRLAFILNNGEVIKEESKKLEKLLSKNDSISNIDAKKRKQIINSRMCRMIYGVDRLSSFKYKSFETYPGEENIYVVKDSDPIMNELIADKDKYLQVRKYVYEAFNKYLTIKINKGKCCFVLTEEEIPEELELSIKPEAKDFFDTALEDKTVSDGVKAYTSIITELITGDASEIFIDEPEAFLHPPLAKKLGGIIGMLAKSQEKQVFISTHSSDFLMGCIEASTQANLIRFTYENNVGNTKMINPKRLQVMMKTPILRNTNVIDAIFYRKVIVTEADSDRTFYQEINYRKLVSDVGNGIDDCLFLNAHNKQSVGDLVKPLRDIGVPTASILDLDMIKDNGKAFSKYLESVNIPSPLKESIRDKKTKLFNAFDEAKESNNYDVMKKDGIDFFKENDLDTYQIALDYVKELNEYGLFPVYKGEVESWLKELNVPGHGNDWLPQIFEKMGDDPSSDYYVEPSQDDVWEFIDSIKLWLETPEREGIFIQDKEE